MQHKVDPLFEKINKLLQNSGRTFIFSLISKDEEFTNSCVGGDPESIDWLIDTMAENIRSDKPGMFMGKGGEA